MSFLLGYLQQSLDRTVLIRHSKNMNNATQAIEAVTLAVIEVPNVTLAYCYELCARFGFKGDAAESILDNANISGTTIESFGKFVGVAVFVS